MIKPFYVSFFLFVFKVCWYLRSHRVLITVISMAAYFQLSFISSLDIQSYTSTCISVIVLEPTLTWKHTGLKKKTKLLFENELDHAWICCVRIMLFVTVICTLRVFFFICKNCRIPDDVQLPGSNEQRYILHSIKYCC